ncbi:MAG: cation:proton antiporter [Bacteroidales bacterium]|nr:cation:proton antiporter [Bacteroidales bacterium]
MFSDPYIIVILTCLLVIISYVYNAISVRTRIPSVLMLLATGIIARTIMDRWTDGPPGTQTLLEMLGIVGLILIVLEGVMELKLRRDKAGMITRSFFSALIILIVSSALIALGIHMIFPQLTYHTCLVNAIPVAVISSAIAIPSVGHFREHKKEFIIYESIFSDILGILIFNLISDNETISSFTVSWLLADFLMVTAVSIVLSLLILLFIDRTTTQVKFFLLMAVMVMIYAIGKMLHLSSLLMILIFGLILNNLDFMPGNRFFRSLNAERLKSGIQNFKLITYESAFLIRTFFFFIFGFSLNLSSLLNFRIISSGMVILVLIYGIRYLYLKYFLRRNLFPELYVAPRGLITILLFYSIPEEYSIGVISEGLLFFVIIVTSIVMIAGLTRKDRELPDMELYLGRKRL